QIDGGYAQYTVADARYVFPIPEGYSDAEAAPLLCAGLIGYRSLKMTGEPVPGQPSRLGIYGFGAAAHIVAPVARHQGREIYAFTRPGDEKAQEFARSLGAVWAGGSDETPPEPLDSAIIFASVGACAGGAQGSAQRRRGGVRRHPHERHPELPLRDSVGGAHAAFGRQPHARRCARVPGARAESAGQDHGRADTLKSGQRGARSLAQRRAHRGRRAQSGRLASLPTSMSTRIYLSLEEGVRRPRQVIEAAS